MPKPKRVRKCPTPWKVSHSTRGEAETHARSLRRKPTGRLQHAYECPCGSWHVGSKVTRAKRKTA